MQEIDLGAEVVIPLRFLLDNADVRTTPQHDRPHSLPRALAASELVLFARQCVPVRLFVGPHGAPAP